MHRKSSRGGLEVKRWLSFNTWAALCFGGSNPAWGMVLAVNNC